MAAARTAANLVDMVREQINLFTLVGTEQVHYRDGFTTDTFNPPAVSILRGINRYLSDLATRTGLRVTVDSALALVNGQRYYTASTSVIAVKTVVHNGRTLLKSSVRELDAEIPGWRSTAPGTPLRWFRQGVNNIGFYPAPNVAAAAAVTTYDYTTHLDDLADNAPTAPLTILPLGFHDGVVWGSALTTAIIDLQNKVQLDRVEFLRGERDKFEASLNTLLDEQEQGEAAPTTLDDWFGSPSGVSVAPTGARNGA